MASRIVRCRSGRSRPPPVNTGSRCSNLASSADGGSTFTRAAASSMARGSPSRRRQMAETVERCLPSARSGVARHARAPQRAPRRDCVSVSSIAGRRSIVGRGRGMSRNSCSPRTRNGSRLVARIVSPGHPPNRWQAQALPRGPARSCRAAAAAAWLRRSSRGSSRAVLGQRPGHPACRRSSAGPAPHR